MSRLIIFLGLLLFSTSCQNKVDGVPIDDELVPYYLIFQEEAARRGVEFDIGEAQIEGYIQNIPDAGVIGACKRNDQSVDNSQIFLDSRYWKTATHLEKEYVMFHELGHCFLRLGHDDSSDSNGICISMMASGVGSCTENYNEITRDSLISELFSK